MNTSKSIRAAALASPLVLVSALVSFAGAEEPPAPSASAPASASASASASAAPAAASAPAPSIGDWAPPDGISEKPTAEEWAKAAPLALLRPSEKCSAAAVREWMRITCLGMFSEMKGVRVAGGSEKEVSIGDYSMKRKVKDPENGKEFDATSEGVHVMFPVRKGDRRVITVNEWVSGGWKSWYIREDIDTTISELWLPGDERPTIVVH